MKRVSQSYKHKKLNFASSLNGFGRGFQALDESANLRNSLISALVDLYLKTKLSVLGPLTYRNTEITDEYCLKSLNWWQFVICNINLV